MSAESEPTAASGAVLAEGEISPDIFRDWLDAEPVPSVREIYTCGHCPHGDMSENTESSGEGPAAWWDERYESDDMPWDTGEPQSALVAAVGEYGLSGRVLDIGCGTGHHALWAAEQGHPAVGIDISEQGIERAQNRAADCDLDVQFRVGNALDLDDTVGEFGTVLDSGLFHAFEADGHAAYVEQISDALRSGGRLFLVGFGPDAPAGAGPVPMSPADVREAFGPEWDELACREAPFETRHGDVPGLLAVFELD